MAKYAVTFGENGVTLTPKKGDAVTFSYLKKTTMAEAIGQSEKEISQRDDNAKALLSMLCEVLGHSRCSGHAGQTAIGAKLASDFKEAVREAEVLVIKPIFQAPIFAKNKGIETHTENGKPHPQWLKIQAQADKEWDSFIKAMRDGMYARYKATASIYFAYFGLLPCVYGADHTPDFDRLLTVTAMEKLIANAKTELEQETNEGISLALCKLCTDLDNRSEKTAIGDVDSALIALQSMLNTYTAIQRDALASKAQQGHIKAIESITQAQIDAKQAEPSQITATSKAVKAQESITAKAKAIADKAMQATKKAIETAPL